MKIVKNVFKIVIIVCFISLFMANLVWADVVLSDDILFNITQSQRQPTVPKEVVLEDKIINIMPNELIIIFIAIVVLIITSSVIASVVTKKEMNNENSKEVEKNNENNTK